MGMTGIGLDPIDDQRHRRADHVIPGGLVHGVAALAMFYKWLKASEAAGSSPAPDLQDIVERCADRQQAGDDDEGERPVCQRGHASFGNVFMESKRSVAARVAGSCRSRRSA